ncbi:CHASE domain-containing protein [Thalassotalea ganghwensis]
MAGKVKVFLYSGIIFLVICALVAYTIKPFSLINFVGTTLGVMSVLMLIFGSFALLSVSFFSVLLNILLYVGGQIYVPLSILLIVILAGILQAFWVKQLTYQLLSEQRWITSRAQLLAFILRVGPFGALVAAITGAIVTILDNASFDVSIGYALLTSWCASLLVSIFLAPWLLFSTKKHKLSQSKSAFVTLASILGCIAIAILFKISQQQHQHYRQDKFNIAEQAFETVLTKELTKVSTQINALAAYFNSSEQVDFQEFQRFSEQVFQPNSILQNVQWAPVVWAKYRKAFEKHGTEQFNKDYLVYSANHQLNIEQSQFAPLIPTLYVYPEHFSGVSFGFDFYAHTEISPAIYQAMNNGSVSATAPFSFNQSNELEPIVLVLKGITTKKVNPFGALKTPMDNEFFGFVVGIIDVSQLINQLNDIARLHQVSFSLVDESDTSTYLITDKSIATHNRLVIDKSIQVFDRTWQLVVAEQSAWLSQDKHWQTWVMLIGVTLGGSIFQLLLLMMAAYSIELTEKVSEKTKELLRVNELSEKENQSKAQFLQTLAIELSQPINQVEQIADKVKEAGRDLQPIESSAFIKVAEQLKAILSSVSDLSTIESRIVNNENQYFDFSLFLIDIEKKIQKATEHLDCKVKFLFDCELPQHINTDKNKLEKLLLALSDNILLLFSDTDVQISVKAHYHKDHATLFFTCSALKDSNEMVINDWLDRDIGNFSTSMALATELLNVLGGNIKMTMVPSGSVVMTISIPITINRQAPSFHSVNENAIYKGDSSWNVLLIEEPLSTNFEITPLLLGLGCQVEIIDDHTELEDIIDNVPYDFIVIDNITSLPFVQTLKRLLSTRENRKVIGFYRGIEYRQLDEQYTGYLAQCLFYPISEDNLKAVINESVTKQ